MFRHSSSNVFEPAECSTENGIFTMIISLSMFYKMAWDPVNNLLASGPHPPQQKKKLMHTPIPQSGSVLCPLVMDYCKEEGEERRAVYVALIDEVNTAGVPGDTDNDSMCGARGRLKKSRNIHSGYIFVCSDFRVRGKNPDLEDMFLATNWNDCCIKVKLYFAIIKAGIFVSLAAPIPSHCYI